jgi:hypothetical protein
MLVRGNIVYIAMYKALYCRGDVRAIVGTGMIYKSRILRE